MKKIIYLSFLIFIITFTSCSSIQKKILYPIPNLQFKDSEDKEEISISSLTMEENKDSIVPLNYEDNKTKSNNILIEKKDSLKNIEIIYPILGYENNNEMSVYDTKLLKITKIQKNTKKYNKKKI
jgi:lipopolysaccharide export LptBFGC system permease protein LptF